MTQKQKQNGKFIISKSSTKKMTSFVEFHVGTPPKLKRVDRIKANSFTQQVVYKTIENGKRISTTKHEAI